MSDLSGTWDRIHLWLAAHAPDVLASLGPPATESQFQAAEQTIGAELPEDVKACYRVHNGQLKLFTAPSIFYGHRWHSLADMAAYVESALERQSPERIASRVSAMARREGLVRLGEPGQEVPYKPSEHDLVGAPATPGEAVVVRHVGYTWDGPDGEIVLARALVERLT